MAEQSSGPVVKRTFHRIAGGLFLVAVGMAAYSLYVALRSPDSQETVLLGQRTFATGSPAGLRVLVRHRSSGQPIGGAHVVLKLSHQKAVAASLGSFDTDENGTLTAAFNFPKVEPGKYDLVVEVSSRAGHDRVVREVEAQHPLQLVVTSDKPLYQPGQTIHLRSLLLNGRTQVPFPSEPIVFEILDAKGNKVFKESRAGSSFGIASADFELASELNFGRYEIRASSGGTTVSRAVEVKRYVLPKFKIQVATSKAYYSPGEAVAGSIGASYFFGKPVAGAEVKLTALGREERMRTDSLGKASFNLVLPDQPAEMSATQEVASLDLKAELRDTAGHVEEKTVPLTVSRRELTISVMPEAGALVPGVENLVYVTTTHPDGSPAVCELTANGNRYQSDPDGVTTLKFTPSEMPLPLDLTARGTAGRNTTLRHQFETGSHAPPLLLRPDHAVYNVGQTVQLAVFTPENDGTLFLDAMKDGQTILTRSFALKAHRATAVLELPEWLTGMVTLRAYRITESGDDRGCSRIVYINPRSALQVRAEISKAVYRPGETARVEFQVRDAEGHPTPAALGISAVDEAIFGLAEGHSVLFDPDTDPSKASPGSAVFAARLLNSEADSAKAQAQLATIVQATLTPSLDELSADYLPPRVLERLRSLKGTREYERLRRRAEYAEAIRLLEEGTGSYNLREATGPEKARAIAAQREAYFKRLGRCVEFIFIGAMICLPIWLGILSGRIQQRPRPPESALKTDSYLPAAMATRNALGMLSIFPFIFYPAAGFLLADPNTALTGWLLMAVEAAIITFGVGLQLARLNNAPELDVSASSALRLFVWAYLAQFFISRVGLFVGVQVTHDLEDGAAVLWVLASIMAPIFFLGILGAHIRQECEVRGIAPPRGKFTVVEALVVVAIVAIMAAMLLPALARAKARGTTVSLMNDLRQVELARQTAELDKADRGGTGPGNTPRLRRDFPETLFWRPELITDEQGRASLDVPLADSITTWRTTVDAISARGALGGVNVPIKVFQDFFVDLDLPASLSLEDEVSGRSPATITSKSRR